MKLADNANDEGTCWPSLRTIATETELSRDTVIRSILLLKSRGLITVIGRTRGRSRTSNKYVLHENGVRSAGPATVIDDKGLLERVVATSGHPPHNKGPTALAQSDHPDSKLRLAVVAQSGTNHHVEPSIEPSSLSINSSEQDNLIQLAEAKRLFEKLSLEVFGSELRINDRWPSDIEHCLNRALPMKRDDWNLINWFYRLPDEHEVFKLTYGRQSMAALIENLPREIQKIRAVKRKIERKNTQDRDEAPSNAKEWTQERWIAFQAMFPGSDPGPFYLLENTLRRQIDEKVKELAAGTKAVSTDPRHA